MNLVDKDSPLLKTGLKSAGKKTVLPCGKFTNILCTYTHTYIHLAGLIINYSSTLALGFGFCCLALEFSSSGDEAVFGGAWLADGREGCSVGVDAWTSSFSATMSLSWVDGFDILGPLRWSEKAWYYTWDHL